MPDPEQVNGLSNSEMRRYGRHLSLPGVGVEGQRKLKSARVLVVGAGGLGAPVSLYLAAAGVGHLGIVDFDVVDESNLQRQVAFGTADLGRRKAEAARDRLADLNPEIEIIADSERLTSENALGTIGDYDIVVDGTDNFATRYLLSDACVLLKKPNVYGSIYQFEGQASVFALAGGPCYRCLYPDPPLPGQVPNCAEGGVFGVLPGIIGSIQAAETIKLILGKGESLGGRLLVFDAARMNFHEIELPRDPSCPACGDNPTIKSLIDYEEFCPEVVYDPAHVRDIGPRELKCKLDANHKFLLLDVREHFESEICSIGGTLIPMAELPSRLDELDANMETVVYCRTGVRSAATVRFLQDAGFSNVWNLRGGIYSWADDIDSSITKY